MTKGAQENRYHPAIDQLFRSAAVRYQAGVIEILLTGALDDGTAGMKAIKKMWRNLYCKGPGISRVFGYAKKSLE